MDALKDLSPTKTLDTKKIKVSGLPAIESVRVAVSGGTLEKLFGSYGRDTTKSKSMLVYVVNSNMGYYFFASVDDQDNFDMYLPIFKDMISSVQIK